MAKISIVVPVYNEERYLKHCVDSIISQSFVDWELILVNDGSTDESPTICDAYADADTRIRVIHQQNKGFSGARNAGLKAVTGTYLILVDGDDWLEPNALKIGVEAMERHDLDLVIGGFNWTIANDVDIISANSVTPPEDYFFRTKDMGEAAPYLWSISPFAGPLHYCVWSRIYRMTIIRDHNLRFDENLFVQEDVKFMYSYLFYADRCMASKEVFYNYCRQYDKDDIAEKPQLDQYRCVEESLITFLKSVLKFNYPEEYQMQMYYRTYDHFIKLSNKLFMPSTGLTEAEQLHHVTCMTESFAFRFFCQVLGKTDPFWGSMQTLLEQRDYPGIHRDWAAKLEEGVAPAGE